MAKSSVQAEVDALLDCKRRDWPSAQTIGLWESDYLVFELAQGYLPYELHAGTRFEASFEHLRNYSATYYTYLWSLAIAKDLLTAFPNGLMARDRRSRFIG